ncbi:hypothetical protein POJ06DRAFT_100451 [Lipomyces tetrasporus]|uniref:Uncharacterized protein n=1 Tax=Lipomyces tetrasporus TaxID=54092 RepID=A0AAD7QSP3_9ASCO|nr:uncharacterized protein POJ06DRAFT_100451 [Lipomyces tetrasporus]KAJ8100266.1 hypothetical protein POJ06DRAFT_100451 [Lipomyces tetrasporus]
MSYYDAVGLLAICDAIETVEAASSSSNSSASPSPPPPGLAHKTLLAAYHHSHSHSHHSHIHAHHIHSHPHSSHHHHHSHHPRGPPASSSSKLPMDHHHHRIQHISAGDLSGLDLDGLSESEQSMSLAPAIDPAFLPIDPAIAAPDSEGSSRAESEEVKGEYTTVSPSLFPSDPNLRPSQTPQRAPPPKRQRPSSTTPGTKPSVSHAPSSSSSAVPPELRSEECHICGRIFRGPKSSTHKQQHIRRLHPDDYQPKRGGKKRALSIASAGAEQPSSAAEQTASDGSSSAEKRVKTKKEPTVPVAVPVAVPVMPVPVSAASESSTMRPSESSFLE